MTLSPAFILATVLTVGGEQPKKPLDVRQTKMGEVMPGPGCWLDERACIETAKRITKAETERDELRKAQAGTLEPKWGAILVGAGAAFLGGILVGYQIGKR